MGQDPQVIKERNERAREELAEDIHALSDKLNVKKQAGAKRDEVVGKVKDKLGMNENTSTSGGGNAVAHQANDVFNVVKHKPLATLAFGYGASKLLSAWRETHSHHPSTGNRRLLGTYGNTEPYTGHTYAGEWEEETPGLRDRAGSAAGSVKDKAGSVVGKVSGVAGGAGSKVSDAGSSVGSKVSDVGSTVGSRAQDMAQGVTSHVPTSGTELEHSVRNNLTAWGIGAVAVGAIAGLLAPSTRFEDERLGEVKENLVDTVQEKASVAKDAGQQVLDQAKETAKDGLSQAKETAKDGLSQAKETAKQELSSDGGSSDPVTTGGPAALGSEASRRPTGLTGTGTSPKPTVGTGANGSPR